MAAVPINERRAKLFGLDAPPKLRLEILATH
jgi:hypothetical protein